MFWKEDSGRQPKLIFPEHEGADVTDYPSPPPNFTLFDDPDFPIGPQGPPPPGPLAPPGPSGPPGLPPGWAPTPPPAGGERARILDPSRERLPQRPSPPEPQPIPIPMRDGDDDQIPQDGRQRQKQRSRSRERVHPHAQVPLVPQIQPMVNPEPDDVSDEDFTATNPSSPSAGPPPFAEQRGRCRREERSRSRERVPLHSFPNASQQPQPAVPPFGIQQSQTLATQGSDEDSAFVDPDNRVSDRSMSPQEREGSRRQGPQTPKGKKTAAEKQPSTPQKAQKYKSIDPDVDGEEPQHEPGTPSNSQTTVPVLPLHQGPAASSQGSAASFKRTTASTNTGDDDSEYSDEYSAQSQNSGRTVL